MSLPKKTVRTEVKAEVHQGLGILAQLSGRTIERYVEVLISTHVVSEAKAAIMRADEFQRAGISGNFRDSAFDDGVMR